MESEEIFAELLRDSPPNPFAVRYTRPRRPTRPRRHPAELLVRGSVWALAIATLFFAVAACNYAAVGANANSYIAFTVSILLYGVTGMGLYSAWAIKRCPRCHFRLCENQPIKWCGFCGHLGQVEQLTKELEPWTRSQHTDDLMSSEGRGVKAAGLLLWRMIIDEVGELALLPSEGDYRMVALIDGQEVELKPPPPFVHRPLVTTVRAIWNSDPLSNSPLNAVIRVHTEERSAMVKAAITPTPAGDSIRFQFSYPDDNSVECPIPQPAAMV